jgi:hypothetical protein
MDRRVDSQAANGLAYFNRTLWYMVTPVITYSSRKKRVAEPSKHKPTLKDLLASQACQGLSEELATRTQLATEGKIRMESDALLYILDGLNGSDSVKRSSLLELLEKLKNPLFMNSFRALNHFSTLLPLFLQEKQSVIMTFNDCSGILCFI